MLKKLIAFFTQKPKETNFPEFPAKIPKKKKLVLKKTTTRKPIESHFVPAKNKSIKKATKRLEKLGE